MFSKEELKRNLLGCLEVALFMPIARKRFGNTKSEALRSFLIPCLCFPLTLMFVYIYPNVRPEIAGDSPHIIALLYSFRLLTVWTLFFGAVYLIAKQVDRLQYFFQFVTANNWLAIPATVIVIPPLLMLAGGTHTWAELYPIMVCLIFYTYAFTGFVTAYVLRVPWEMAAFIAIVCLAINDTTLKVLYWVGQMI